MTCCASTSRSTCCCARPGVQGKIVHRRLQRVSPLAVPVLMAIGQESVAGAADDCLLEELTAELIAEAMGHPKLPTSAS